MRNTISKYASYMSVLCEIRHGYDHEEQWIRFIYWNLYYFYCRRNIKKKWGRGRINKINKSHSQGHTKHKDSPVQRELEFVGQKEPQCNEQNTRDLAWKIWFYSILWLSKLVFHHHHYHHHGLFRIRTHGLWWWI